MEAGGRVSRQVFGEAVAIRRPDLLLLDELEVVSCKACFGQRLRRRAKSVSVASLVTCGIRAQLREEMKTSRSARGAEARASMTALFSLSCPRTTKKKKENKKITKKNDT